MGDYNRGLGGRSSRRGPSSGRKNKERLNAVRGARSGSRKRREGFDITKLLMYGIAAVILVICIALAVKGFGSRPASGEESTSTEEPETELEKEVTVDGVNIAGMLREEAKETIMDHLGWSMKVAYGDKEAEVPNLLEGRVDELLEEIYQGEPKESYELRTDGLTESIEAAVDTIADSWDVKAKNGGISSFDSETGKFTFAEGTVGIVINRDKMTSDIEAALEGKEYQAVIQAEAGEQQPEMTAAQAREKYKTLGTYTTTTTSNKDRNENIRLASNALNGKILQPGEEFSFNDTTGARTLEKGYKPAGAYVNGVLVEEPGGGVCQVSSTLYNAVIFSGLKTTERHAHSYEPSYVTPGEDAMVSYGGPDMKFRNTSDFPIAIRTSFANQELTISIYGVQILEDGVKVRMHSEKVSDLDPPAPTYEEDLTLLPGVEVVAKEATPGSRWTTNLVITKDGEVTSDEFFHNSTYRGKPATIKRNTSGTVISTEASSDGLLSSDESGLSESSGEGQTEEGAAGESQGEPASQENPATSAAGSENENVPESTEDTPAGPSDGGPSSQGPSSDSRPTLSPVNPNQGPGSGPAGPGVN